MTQSKRVLGYMRQYGSITTLEAFRDLGITRLSGVIFDLRKSYVINSKTEQSRNRYGEKQSYNRNDLEDGASGRKEHAERKYERQSRRQTAQKLLF